MKHHIIFTAGSLPVMAILCFFLCLTACQNSVDNPSISCPEMNMTAIIQGRSSSFFLTNSILFRQQTDTGGLKFLSIETLSDTFKVVLNLTDGMFDENAIKNDSLHLDTFSFSRTGRQKNGLVAAAIMNTNGDFNFLTTDTSSITIHKMNTRSLTVSGSFYFMAENRTISGEGTFENACYVSLQ